jgi:hypothetical protein
VPTPGDWKDAIREKTIGVLQLAREPKKRRAPGWCTYTYEHEQAPELEVLCGGINSKTPRAGAVWRQGFLLHFGFDLAPAEMNESGQALLVNSIAYVARFTEDRPLVRTPCIFVQNVRIFDRDVVARRLKGSSGEDLKALEYYLAPGTYKELAGKSREQIRDWFTGARDYLNAGAGKGLAVDEEARSFGVPPAGPDFLLKTSAALSEPRKSSLARKLLARYCPDGPGVDASPQKWRDWATENRQYLFFSDTGGYRWYLDPLAKRRGVPTAKLRGPARATTGKTTDH